MILQHKQTNNKNHLPYTINYHTPTRPSHSPTPIFECMEYIHTPTYIHTYGRVCFTPPISVYCGELRPIDYLQCSLHTSSSRQYSFTSFSALYEVVQVDLIVNSEISIHGARESLISTAFRLNDHGLLIERQDSNPFYLWLHIRNQWYLISCSTQYCFSKI